ncbi:MAG: signal peptide peptidase SppA [Actinomycetota bacterium]|nr:signal peptide peptidase SppA [Actinomycetota bacterium]
MNPDNPNDTQTENRTRRRRKRFLIGGAVAVGLLVLTLGTIGLVLVAGPGGGDGGVAAAPETYEEEYVSGEGPDKIAAIPVEGLISGADRGVAGTVPATTPEGLRDALRQAAEDENVAAVILEISSPGGGVTASDRMYEEILEFKESSGKPVLAALGATAASGGYYVATAADEILAEETTLTGSLGVILQLPNFTETADKIGFEQNIIKSGEFKDMGSSFRDITPQEREIFQSIVDENYEAFVEVIVAGRDLPEQRVRELADGRIYSGKQARELDLVDSLGDLEEAARNARERADVEEATVVRYVRNPGLAELLRARLAPQEPEVVQIMKAAGVSLEAEPQYLYLPGL